MKNITAILTIVIVTLSSVAQAKIEIDENGRALMKGFNRRADIGWVYEVREVETGRIVEAASLSLQLEAGTCWLDFGNRCPALAIRNTNSDDKNGEFLTVVYPTLKNDRCYYQAPANEMLDRSKLEGGSFQLTNIEPIR